MKAESLRYLLNRLDEERANLEKAESPSAKLMIGRRIVRIQRLLGILA